MEVVIRGGKVANMSSGQNFEDRNHENLALFSLFLSTAKRVRTVAEQDLEEDKTSFLAKSEQIKESM